MELDAENDTSNEGAEVIKLPAPDGPPEDPEDWTDEQWIVWLNATDEPDEAPQGVQASRERPRQRGGMLGAAMLGLRDAIYGHPDDEPVVVVDSSGDPPDDDRPEVHLDPDHPERSEVIVHTKDPRRAPGTGRSQGD